VDEAKLIHPEVIAAKDTKRYAIQRPEGEEPPQ
jgi:hypothetical protein